MMSRLRPEPVMRFLQLAPLLVDDATIDAAISVFDKSIAGAISA